MLRSDLQLTTEQDAAARQYLRQRITECRREMGLSATPAPRGMAIGGTGSLGFGSSSFSYGFGATDDSWAGRRERYQAFYDGNLEWRKTHYGPESVFHTSNHTFNIPSRFARLVAAQLDGDQLSTDPFFACMPQPAAQGRVAMNADLARGVETYMQGEIGRSNLRDVLAEARQAALVRNDATVKVSWVRRASSFRGTATVLVNAYMAPIGVGPDGQPVMRRFSGPPIPMPDGSTLAPDAPFVLPTGEHVYQNDDVIPDPEAGVDRLRKYPDFPMPPPGTCVFETIPNLKQTSVDYEGLEAATVFFKDYLYWPRAASLAQSDIHVHVFDDTPSSLRRRYGQWQSFESYATFLAEAGRARPAQGESEVTSVRQCTGIHECYVLADFDQDGEDEWYFMVHDWVNDRTVFADYLKNHMKEPPFVMIPGIEKVEGRAYGVGVYEKLRDTAFLVDIQINRINVKGSKSQSFTFLDREAIQEAADGQDVVIGSDHVYQLTGDGAARYGKDGSPVRRVNLAELTQEEWKILETAVQFGQLEIGLLSAGDGAASDLNSSKTATGVMSNERSGTALQNKTADLHAACFRRILEMATDLALENMPTRVAVELEDGQTLLTLSRDEVRDVDRDVRLLLTRARSTESLQRNAQATALVLQYLALAKAQQKLVREFFIGQLRALDVQDADDKLPIPTDEEIAAEAQAAQQGAQKPPSDSMSIAYKDAPPPIQRQMEAAMGMQPLTPDQEQQVTEQSVQAQQIPTPAHHLKVLPHVPA